MAADHVLNQTQLETLASRLNDPDIGGFSVKGSGSDPMMPVTTPGFTVGGHIGENNLPYPIEPGAIGAFHSRPDVQEALGQDKYYLGGWDARDNTSALDVSELHPVTSTSPEEHNRVLLGAYGQGKSRGESSIGSFVRQADGSVNYDDDVDIDYATPYTRSGGRRGLEQLILELRDNPKGIMRSIKPQGE